MLLRACLRTGNPERRLRTQRRRNRDVDDLDLGGRDRENLKRTGKRWRVRGRATRRRTSGACGPPVHSPSPFMVTTTLMFGTPVIDDGAWLALGWHVEEVKRHPWHMPLSLSAPGAARGPEMRPHMLITPMLPYRPPCIPLSAGKPDD
jgi:hypothetical protein